MKRIKAIVVTGLIFSPHSSFGMGCNETSPRAEWCRQTLTNYGFGSQAAEIPFVSSNRWFSSAFSNRRIEVVDTRAEDDELTLLHEFGHLYEKHAHARVALALASASSVPGIATALIPSLPGGILTGLVVGGALGRYLFQKSGYYCELRADRFAIDQILKQPSLEHLRALNRAVERFEQGHTEFKVYQELLAREPLTEVELRARWFKLYQHIFFKDRAKTFAAAAQQMQNLIVLDPAEYAAQSQRDRATDQEWESALREIQKKDNQCLWASNLAMFVQNVKPGVPVWQLSKLDKRSKGK